MSDEIKIALQAVATVMQLAKIQTTIDEVRLGHLREAEEVLTNMPPRRLLDAFVNWDNQGRPTFDFRQKVGHIIPGTDAASEKQQGRFGKRFGR